MDKLCERAKNTDIGSLSTSAPNEARGIDCVMDVFLFGNMFGGTQHEFFNGGVKR